MTFVRTLYQKIWIPLFVQRNEKENFKYYSYLFWFCYSWKYIFSFLPFPIPYSLSLSLTPFFPPFFPFFWGGASNIPSLRIIIINWKQRIGFTLIFWQMGIYSSILYSTGVILILYGKLFVLNILWEPFLYAKNYEQRLGRRISG